MKMKSTRVSTGIRASAIEEQPVGSSTSAPTVAPLPSIRVPIVPVSVMSPQDSVLGISNPLPDTVNNTYVNILRLKELLTDYPDQRLVSSIIDGFKFGFDLGYKGTLTNTFPKNNKSAITHRQGVTEAIRKEISRGHTAGPFPLPPFPINHISPLGAAPKPDGTIRLIMDLSWNL